MSSVVRDSVDVAIVGAGISGLAAAYELQKRNRSIVVLERADRAGGIIQTEHLGGFVIDAGPDALLVQKPGAIALCNEIGLGDRLIPTKPPRTAYVLRDRRLHPLPEGSVLGFPARLRPLLRSRLFSARAKARMAGEVLIPRRPRRERDQDESIASFVRRRFGSEAVTYIAEPLLAGIHAGDVERLSMRTLFPRLSDAEAQFGSVIKSFRHHRATVSADGVFRSFPRGLAELVESLMRVIPAESVQLRSQVTSVETGDGFALHVDGGRAVHARAVILAIPGFAAAPLLRPIDADLSTACDSIRYLSTATVVFAFPREAVHHNLAGTGFVVPRAEGISITAAAWISSKWPYRAPEGQALLRAFLGGARDPNVLARTDDELTNAALQDLTGILNISGVPAFIRVYRWNRSSPQQEVGHGELMTRIEGMVNRHSGLFISAAGFRGVGIPDCIADARVTAAKAAEFVKRS